MQYLQQRQEVLQAAREIYEAQLVSGTWGNVSVKVPDQSLLLITPSGMDYDSMGIEDIALLDWEQKLVEGQFKPSVETPLHLEIYKKRPDIKAIVHVHSLYATAFAVARQNIPVILEETAQIIGHEIRVTSYAPCGSKQLVENTMKALGKDRKAVLLANHGLIGMGANMAEALKVCYIADKTAQIAIYARTLGPLHSLRADDIEHLQHNFKQYGQKK
ncbi:MAG: class II aldolase/adducin family protein [Syntrophomonadaceae bacterium]|nr:class II aldolase/adducin family protein [Syntrophomonadaceae bacterium]